MLQRQVLCRAQGSRTAASRKRERGNWADPVGPASSSVGAQTGKGNFGQTAEVHCGSTEKGVWPGGRRRPGTLCPGCQLGGKPCPALAASRGPGLLRRQVGIRVIVTNSTEEKTEVQTGADWPRGPGTVSCRASSRPHASHSCHPRPGSGHPGQVLTAVCPGVLEPSLSCSSGEGWGRLGHGLQTGLEHGADQGWHPVPGLFMTNPGAPAPPQAGPDLGPPPNSSFSLRV